MIYEDQDDGVALAINIIDSQIDTNGAGSLNAATYDDLPRSCCRAYETMWSAFRNCRSMLTFSPEGRISSISAMIKLFAGTRVCYYSLWGRLCWACVTGCPGPSYCPWCCPWCANPHLRWSSKLWIYSYRSNISMRGRGCSSAGLSRCCWSQCTSAGLWCSKAQTCSPNTNRAPSNRTFQPRWSSCSQNASDPRLSRARRWWTAVAARKFCWWSRWSARRIPLE